MADKMQVFEDYIGEIDLSCDKMQSGGAEVLVGDHLLESQTIGKEHFCSKGFFIRNLRLSTGCVKSTLSLDKFGEFEFLTKGSHGVIWLAKPSIEFDSSTENCKNVVLKQIEVKDQQGFRPHDIYKERDLMIYLQHSSICKLLGAFHSLESSFLVMEMCQGTVGELKSTMEPKQKVRHMVQLLEGLSWIHSKQIIHCDLTPHNVMINAKSDLVISDFGSSQILKKGYSSVQVPFQLSDAGYQDAEATKDGIYSKASDVFSAACIMFEMDTYDCLLKYRGNENVPASVYEDAINEGRWTKYPPPQQASKTNIKSRMVSDAVNRKIPLVDRVKHSFTGDLLSLMICPRFSRLTAEQALHHQEFERAKAKVYLTNEILSQDVKYFTSKPKINRSVALVKPVYKGNQTDIIEESMQALYYTRQVFRKVVKTNLTEYIIKRFGPNSFRKKAKDGNSN